MKDYETIKDDIINYTAGLLKLADRDYSEEQYITAIERRYKIDIKKWKSALR